MVVSLRDGIKLFGISVVCFCAVYVCTFMLNYYLDVLPLKELFEGQPSFALYEAQLATARFTSLITGGVLGAIAVVMLVFYVKLYIDKSSTRLGIIKALGYSRARIALKFWVFGLSVLIGCALGFGLGWASMQFIYDGLTIEGMGEITPTFHAWLMIVLVVVPTVVFSALACLYAYISLKRPAIDLLRGKNTKANSKVKAVSSERPFLLDMCVSTLKSKKSLVFFVAFSCFCFSAMVQMGLSMENLTSATMGYMIMMIGIVLAVVSMFMAVTSLICANANNLSVMKVFGYSLRERVISVFGGYAPFAALGFALGTVYQYGLLKFMINLVFANVENVPEYNFNVPVFFVTLAAFVVACGVLMLYYTYKVNKISVKEIMTEK